jgi:hypothetical protein
MSQAISGCFKPYPVVSGYFGAFQAVPGLSGLFKTIFSPFLDIVSVLKASQSIWKRFRSFWAVLKLICLGPFWSIPGQVGLLQLGCYSSAMAFCLSVEAHG